MSPRSDSPTDDPRKRWLLVLEELVSSPPTLTPPVLLDDEPVADDDTEDTDDDDSSSSSSGKKATGYDPSTGQYGGRPGKPSTLRGVNEAGDPLTAHHLYPWNKLRSDLNAALLDATGVQMKAVMTFAQHTPPPGFYTELAKDAGDRCDDFSTWVNEAAKALCWGPANIFMGPLGNKRSDDPGEKVDVSRMKSGVMTPASAVADLLDQQGGISKASKLTKLLARNVREAQVNESGEVVSRPYDKQDWEDDGAGKRVQRRGVRIKEGGGNISVEDDEESGWTAATKTTTGTSTPKPKKPTLSQEQIERLREEAEQRRLEKERSKDVEDVADPDSDGGVFGLFDDDNEDVADPDSDSGLSGLFGDDD